MFRQFMSVILHQLNTDINKIESDILDEVVMLYRVKLSASAVASQIKTKYPGRFDAPQKGAA